MRISDYRGKVVVVNFWATWCVPCKAEIPLLIEAKRKYKRKGVEIIGIAINDTPHAVERFSRLFKFNYPLLLGDYRTIDAYSGLGNGLAGVPETFFIDRNGKVLGEEVGALTASSLKSKIEAALCQ